MTRNHSPLLGWADDVTYDELFKILCFRYHPAVAAILADETLKSREYGLRARATHQQRQRKAS